MNYQAVSEFHTRGTGATASDGHVPELEIDSLQAAISRAQEWLLGIQRNDGHWSGELEGDSILETEYVLLLQFLGIPDRDKVRKLCNYVIRKWQSDDGGLPIYPGGSSDVSASVKAYFACKLSGFRAEEPFMQALRDRILALGGVTKCNTFTKLYLSIFGQYDWDGVPTIPPETVLFPSWFYFNIYEMSSWSRAILIPLAVINANKPLKGIPAGCGIDELFIGGRHGKHLRLPWDKRLFTARNFFLALDRVMKILDRLPKPLRKRALKESEKWLLERQERSGGLGAIFPAMTHAVMAYKCLGYADDHPAVQHEIRELEKFEIEENDEIRVVPCFSPVWDTAIAVNALIDSGLPPNHHAIQRAVEWLLGKQTKKKGDWAIKTRGVEPGGWIFEYENEFYPDVDDSIMVLMALYKASCPDGAPWTSAPEPARSAMKRGLDWVFAMQNKDGGWGSFDRDNQRMIFQFIPFADHNAMLDPATTDITARTIEMASFFGISRDDPRIQPALQFVYKDQCSDGSWFGRWGSNYLYGTWQAIRGLARIGEDLHRSSIKVGGSWLKSVQKEDGSWGESIASYDDPQQKGIGPSTASQTAWALMGLINAGESESDSVKQGFEWLIRTQRTDGTWDEPWFTGTGFPRVFYLRYHLYCHYFPLWAMGQYLSATSNAAKGSE